MMKTIGLDPLPGGQVEVVQICPNGRKVIFITLKDSVQIDSFCRYDVLAITHSGIRSIMIKPAGKKEVVITMKGIHPNVVLDYLSRFGKIVSTKVVHGVFPGDRAYKMEVKSGVNIGSYHFIDGQKISLRYAGQQPTCIKGYIRLYYKYCNVCTYIIK